jgi:hypothetical protein
VGGFLLVFFIIFYGFSQAHTMVFQGKLEEFRTVGDSCFTLMRSLLGNFDFVRLQEANQYMGPLLFIVFVVLAVFVVLNMLIAIISNAYDITRRELENKPSWDLLQDLHDYIVIQLMHGNYKHTLYILTMIAPKMVGSWSDGGGGKIDGIKSTAIYPEEKATESKEGGGAVTLAAPPAAAFSGPPELGLTTISESLATGLAATFAAAELGISPTDTKVQHVVQTADLIREVSSMRAQQREMRQVMALLTLEVQHSSTLFKTVLSAATNPTKQARAIPGENRTREI